MPGWRRNLWSRSGQIRARILRGIALDLLRLVDPVDQDDDARVAQRVEDALELAQQLIALLGAQREVGRQRLAAQLGRLEPEQLPAQAPMGRG